MSAPTTEYFFESVGLSSAIARKFFTLRTSEQTPPSSSFGTMTPDLFTTPRRISIGVVVVVVVVVVSSSMRVSFATMIADVRTSGNNMDSSKDSTRTIFATVPSGKVTSSPSTSIPSGDSNVLKKSLPLDVTVSADSLAPIVALVAPENKPASKVAVPSPIRTNCDVESRKKVPGVSLSSTRIRYVLEVFHVVYSSETCPSAASRSTVTP